jgi:hypothetical protein
MVASVAATEYLEMAPNSSYVTPDRTVRFPILSAVNKLQTVESASLIPKKRRFSGPSLEPSWNQSSSPRSRLEDGVYLTARSFRGNHLSRCRDEGTTGFVKRWRAVVRRGGGESGGRLCRREHDKGYADDREDDRTPQKSHALVRKLEGHRAHDEGVRETRPSGEGHEASKRGNDARQPPIRRSGPHHLATGAPELPARHRAICCFPPAPGADHRQKPAAGCWRLRRCFLVGCPGSTKPLGLLSLHLKRLLCSLLTSPFLPKVLGLVFFGR